MSETKKKLTVVEFIRSLGMGGAETLVKEYCLHLEKKRLNVVVLCLFRREHEEAKWQDVLASAGIEVVYISDFAGNRHGDSFLHKVIYRAKTLPYLYRAFCQINPDVVHIHLDLCKMIVPILPFLQSNIRYVYTVHNEPRKYFNQGSLSFIELLSVKFMYKIKNMKMIALHDTMKNELISNFGFDNAVTVNNGIDLEKFQVLESKAMLRKKEGIPENSFVIGHVGRFSLQKNHEFIIRVFAQIHRDHPKSFLLLVGDGDLKSKTIDMLKKFKLNGAYKILSNRSDVPQILKMMDVFLFPSLYEGLPVSLIEAQVSGLPCIISDTIKKEAVISNLVRIMSLHSTVDEWATCVYTTQISDVKYYGLKKWDINETCRQLEHIYFNRDNHSDKGVYNG